MDPQSDSSFCVDEGFLPAIGTRRKLEGPPADAIKVSDLIHNHAPEGPVGWVILANLYGSTTMGGGAYTAGTVFEMLPLGSSVSVLVGSSPRESFTLKFSRTFSLHWPLA